MAVKEPYNDCPAFRVVEPIPLTFPVKVVKTASDKASILNQVPVYTDVSEYTVPPLLAPELLFIFTFVLIIIW